MIAGVELNQLRYVVEVSANGHIGRAAERLHVSQPAVSYAVKRLETELGVRLFDRHPGGVTPTEVGLEVVAQAGAAIRQADRVVAVARRHRRRMAGSLRVGFVASGAGDLTTAARAEFVRRFPGRSVEGKRFDWGAEVAAVREGLVDVAFGWLPADLSGLESRVVHVEPRVVGLPAGHRLAGDDSVSIMDVNDDPLMWTDKAPREWVDWWAVNPRPDGREPRWGPKNDNVEEMLQQVAEGNAVCFAPASMARYYSLPDLAWVPIRDVPPLRVALVWPSGTNPLIDDFVTVVRELSDADDRPEPM